jgi:peptidyl-prolyl cis-trans isomerase C
LRLHNSSTLLAFTTLLALGGCSPAEDIKPSDATVTAIGSSKEPAAATVNGTVITQRMVDLIAKRGADAGHPDTPEARAKIIDQLALQIVLADEAVKKGLDKGPEVAEQIDAIRQSVLANAYVEDYLKNNPVRDETVQAAYDRIKANITGNEYEVRHILVAKESEAKDIIAKLKKDPASFDKLAKERSTDEGSKDKGGDIGWLDLKGMDPDFAVAVTKLNKGKFTTEPVKTRFGYHVILLEDFKPIEAPPLDAVKVQLTQQIQQQNVKKQVEALKAAAKIEIAGAPSPQAPTTSSPPTSTN